MSGAPTDADARPLIVGGASTPSAGRFDLPDLCSPLAVFGVVMACQLLAILLTVARQSGWPAFYTELGPIALLTLWAGLTSAALLCRLRPALRRFSVRDGSLLALLTVLLTVAAVSEAAYWLGQSIAPDPAAATNWFPGDHWSFLSRNLAIAGLVAALLLRYFYVSNQWQRNIRRQAEFRLHALQARIRPHFLFNSMNTIAALMQTSPPAAEQAIEDLADLFRASLRDGREEIPLSEELEITRVYERMEQHRLGDRLRVVWRLDDLPVELRLPGLTIQPLLENAIYHGIEPSPEPGVVSIEGGSDGETVRISISNPLPPPGARPVRSGNRIALDNIRERLALAFDGRSSLSVQDGPDRFTVTVAIPHRVAGS